MAVRFRLVNNQKFRKDKDGNKILPKDLRSYLYLILQENNKRLRFSTGIKLSPDYWNQQKQTFRKSYNGVPLENYNEYIRYLNALKSFTDKLYLKQKAENGIIDFEVISKELSKRFKGKGIEDEKSEDRITLYKFIDLFIEESILTKTSGTIMHYKSLKNTLIDFGKYWRPLNPETDFNDITLDWYNLFLDYLKNTRKLKPNTYGKRITTLKVILGNATNKGINNNLTFKNKLFRSFQEEVDNIYLNENEIRKIYEFDLSEYKAGYTIVRDLFIIGCYTGLRFSDFKRLKKENIRDNKIFVKTEKNRQQIVIPLHPVVKEIFEKYNQNLPIALSNQKTNEYLKEIGQIAGINTPIIMSNTEGHLDQKKVVPKYRLIKTHTARRSFATNAYLAKIPVLSIRKITGHKTDKIFYRYIKVDEEQNADILSNHEFFK